MPDRLTFEEAKRLASQAGCEASYGWLLLAEIDALRADVERATGERWHAVGRRLHWRSRAKAFLTEYKRWKVKALEFERERDARCEIDGCGHLARFHDDVPNGTHACVHCAWVAAMDRVTERTRERDALAAALEKVQVILQEAPELNPSNYSHDDAMELNDAAIEAWKIATNQGQQSFAILAERDARMKREGAAEYARGLALDFRKQITLVPSDSARILARIADALVAEAVAMERAAELEREA